LPLKLLFFFCFWVVCPDRKSGEPLQIKKQAAKRAETDGFFLPMLQVSSKSGPKPPKELENVSVNDSVNDSDDDS